MTDIAIIGGGVIGLSTALYLADSGYNVTIYEKDRVGSQASTKNAGLIVPSMYNPYPLSIDIFGVLRLIASSRSPVKISLRGLGCKPILEILKARRRLANADWRILRRMGSQAIAAVEKLVSRLNIDIEYRRGDILELYIDEEYLDNAKEYAREVRIDGLDVKELEYNEIRELEPSITEEVVGGLRYVSDASIDPVKYIEGLNQLARDMDIKTHENKPINEIHVDGSRIGIIRDGRLSNYDWVVLAAGPWTPSLTHKLGINIPLYPAKGYIVEYTPSINVTHQLMLEEIKVVVNPYRDRLRLAGIMDFVGFRDEIPTNRLFKLIGMVKRYLGGFEISKPIKVDYAYRPCTPDEIPLIGPLPKYRNLIIATGHCRFGLTFSGLTALIVKDYIETGRMKPEYQIFNPVRIL